MFPKTIGEHGARGVDIMLCSKIVRRLVVISALPSFLHRFGPRFDKAPYCGNNV